MATLEDILATQLQCDLCAATTVIDPRPTAIGHNWVRRWREPLSGKAVDLCPGCTYEYRAVIAAHP